MRQEKQTLFGTLPWFPEVNSDRRIWNCASIHHDLLMVFFADAEHEARDQLPGKRRARQNWTAQAKIRAAFFLRFEVIAYTVMQRTKPTSLQATGFLMKSITAVSLMNLRNVTADWAVHLFLECYTFIVSAENTWWTETPDETICYIQSTHAPCICLYTYTPFTRYSRLSDGLTTGLYRVNGA